MYEQTDVYLMREKIMNHPDITGMDPHDRKAFIESLPKNLKELERIYDDLCEGSSNV